MLGCGVSGVEVLGSKSSAFTLSSRHVQDICGGFFLHGVCFIKRPCTIVRIGHQTHNCIHILSPLCCMPTLASVRVLFAAFVLTWTASFKKEAMGGLGFAGGLRELRR